MKIVNTFILTSDVELNIISLCENPITGQSVERDEYGECTNETDAHACGRPPLNEVCRVQIDEP